MVEQAPILWWTGLLAEEIAEPVVEALMFGQIGSGHYAFLSQGRPIKVVRNN